MKKQLIAFIAASSFMTQVKAQDDDCCYCPQVKPCIDSVCYTPAYYDLQCDCGFFVTGEFLYWYARETNLTYGLKVVSRPQTIPNLPLFPEDEIADVLFAKDFLYCGVDWEPGFRVGLGYNTSCDGWDFYAHYTYYRNSRSDKTTVPRFDSIIPNEEGELGLIYIWGNPAMNQDPYFHQIKAKWKLDFNSIDLELGRKYWLSPCFTLRPYAAVRGAWTETHFNTEALFEDGEDFLIPRINLFVNDTVKNKSTFWGVGFLTGLQPTWYFCDCFSLYSNFDAALIWGKYEGTKNATYFQTDESLGGIFGIRQNQSNSSQANYYKMQAIIDVGIGLHWEDTWCCNQFRTGVDVGWEHHIWFEHSDRHILGDQIAAAPPGEPAVLFPRTYDSIVSNLVFGGLVVRARFDF